MITRYHIFFPRRSGVCSISHCYLSILDTICWKAIGKFHCLQKHKRLLHSLRPRGRIPIMCCPLVRGKCQQLFNSLWTGLLKICLMYLDNVVIYPNDWDVHLEHIKKLPDSLAHLTINRSWVCKGHSFLFGSWGGARQSVSDVYKGARYWWLHFLS